MHMMRHAEILRPKFEMVEDTFERELGGLGIGTWTKPNGGYFISFDTMEGCAKEVVAKCAEAGVKMTPAGASFPYGKDPEDKNIRVAPSFPPLDELKKAAEVLVLSVKLISAQHLLNA
jgi:DNA-binding transcriptional MocR family regulator